MPNHVDLLEAEPITLDRVRDVARANFDDGHRFVTLSVVDLGDGNLDIIYHFDKGLAMRHYRLTVPVGVSVPSISDIYFSAMLIENESRDHYGIKWDGLVIDFQGCLYLEKETPPPLLRGPSCTLSAVTGKKTPQAPTPTEPFSNQPRTSAKRPA